MRATRIVALASVLAGACMPLLDVENATVEEVGSYDTAVRADLPLPEGEGTAPYAGSLGPPDEMVEPVMPGTATTTREGSGGPPIRGTPEDEPVGEAPEGEEAPRERRWLHGHDPDAW